MNSGPRISVIIPTFRRTDRLLMTFESVCRQSLPEAEREIIVVNDDPNFESWPTIARRLRAHEHTLVLESGGRGAAGARNVGAKAARAPLLFFLDDDTILSPGVLQAHLEAHREDQNRLVHGCVVDLTAFKFAPDTAVLQGALVGAKGRILDLTTSTTLQSDAHRYGARRSFIERQIELVAGNDSYASLRWLFCIGTNTSVSARVFAEAGGFDEHYGAAWGGEDIELGLRLLANAVMFERIEATAYHVPTARRNTDAALRTFWEAVAVRHRSPKLIRIGEFLSGRRQLEELL